MLPISCAFLALYPVLFLWSHNWEEVYLSEVILLVVLLLAFTTLLYHTFKFMLRSSLKGTLTTFLFLFMFVSFDHFFSYASPVFQFLLQKKMFGFVIGRYAVLLPAWASLFGVLFILIYRSKKNFAPLLRILTVVSTVLVLTTLPNLVYSWRSTTTSPQESRPVITSPFAKGSSSVGYLPNIYYIILDAHGRQDVLKNLHDHDNSDFIDELKQLGFYVAGKSCSNYPTTIQSIPSSITSTYLPKNYSPYAYLNSSSILKFLKSHGYLYYNIGNRIVAFTRHSDLADKEPLEQWNGLLSLNLHPGYFCREFIKKTAWGPFYNLGAQRMGGERIIQQFEALEQLAATERQPFVAFCHILCPHEPFVLDEHGKIKGKVGLAIDYSRPHMTLEGYNSIRTMLVDQTTGIDLLALKTINAILEKSNKSPIIILQSDHGPPLLMHWFKHKKHTNTAYDDALEKTKIKERMSILNAYHFPQGGEKKLYASITPVNSFRVLCNHYFDTNLELLSEKCSFLKDEYTPEQINSFQFAQPLNTANSEAS